MNLTALVTALVGTACGGLAVYNVAVRKRPWVGVGTIAVGVALVIGMVTEGNASRAEH